MQKPHQITIIDIAKELGISPSTVSRALHDHKSISTKTKEKVTKLARAWNYQPNHLALSLLNKKTGMIGIIVPEITGYFFATVISGVQDMMAKAGYKLLISQTNESFEEEKRLIQEMIALRLDGILISPTFGTTDYSHFEQLQKAGIQMVIFDRDCPNFEADKVLVDSYHGAYKAVEYLIGQGRKHIAHIAGPSTFPTFKQRLDGYMDAHRDHDLKIHPDLVIQSNGFSSEDGVEAVQKLLQTHSHMDALFTVNDAVAIGAMHTLRKNNYQIPGDISVIGFDDEPYAQYIHPALSTVWQPAYELGMLSAKILMNYFEDKNIPGTYRYEVLRPELMIRDSSL